MPKFWKLYYQAAEAKTDYQPADPAVMRQTNVDQKAKLLTNFEPDSNEYAQAAGVAGMALYHVVVGADGKPEEIAVARPIGFGLDENAVASIRKASFSPAMKDGKPVAVLLDLVVQFRIYSKRTSVVAPPESKDKGARCCRGRTVWIIRRAGRGCRASVLRSPYVSRAFVLRMASVSHAW